MNSLERVALLDNLLDRVHQLEQRYAELASSAVMVQEVTYRGAPGEGLLNGWVATGTAFRDIGSRIVLDVRLPGITLASGGVIRSADYVADVSGFKIDGGLAEFNNVTVRGTIHAASGSIAGWTIASGHLYAGSGSTRTGLRPADFPFYAGSETPGSAPFRVTPAGMLVATNATIAGSITATTGNIGGWTISSDRLAATNIRLISGAANAARLEVGTGTNANTAGVNSPNASSDVAIWSGATHANRASAPFRVTAAGALTATSATVAGSITATSGSIGGWTIDTGHLYAGSGSTRAGLRPADFPFYAGSETPGSAPFRVTPAGALTATNATITGGITATSGSIGGWTIDTGHLYAGSGSTRAGLRPADFPFYAGSETPGSAPFRVTPAGALTATNATITGSITASSGSIGGWTISSDRLAATNIRLISGAVNTARLEIGTGTDANTAGVNSPGAAGDIALWAGATHANRATAPFRVTAVGALTATSAAITGSITATSGSIGGWTIDTGHLYAGSGTTRAGLRPADFPFYAGSETPSAAPFRVTPAGVLVASSAAVTGAITATSGAFTGTVTVGTTTPRIEIDGANARIRSSDYVAGQRGITMEASGFAEFGNVDVRGALKATVFEYGQRFVTGGTFVIARGAGKLLNDCTSVDSPTTFNVDIEDPDGMSHAAAGALWSVNDHILLHDALVGTLWATVSSKTDMSTYWRLAVVKQSPGAGTNYTFRRGMAVTNYGQSGQGFLHLTADETNAPYYSVRTHAGSPWSAQTEVARLGNLDGNWGYSSATYGIALGEYASGRANLTWDSTNGLRLRTHATTVIQLDNAGDARIEGVLNIGTSGGIYQGTGTFASPTTGLKVWNESGVGRIAGYNAGTLQWGTGTDGSLYAGGGAVVLSASGVGMLAPMQLARSSYVQWDTSGGAFRARVGADSAGTLEMTALTTLSVSIGLPPSHSQRLILSDHARVTCDVRIGGGLYTGGVGVDPADGEIHYTSDLRPVRSGTTYTAYAIVPLTTALTHPSLVEGIVAVGTYTVGPVGSGATYEFNYPPAARMLHVRMSGRWTAISEANVAYLRPNGGSTYEAGPVVRANVVNLSSDDTGWTPLDNNALAQLVVMGAPVSLRMFITGYAL